MSIFPSLFYMPVLAALLFVLTNNLLPAFADELEIRYCYCTETGFNTNTRSWVKYFNYTSDRKGGASYLWNAKCGLEMSGSEYYKDQYVRSKSLISSNLNDETQLTIHAAAGLECVTETRESFNGVMVHSLGAMNDLGIATPSKTVLRSARQAGITASMDTESKDCRDKADLPGASFRSAISITTNTSISKSGTTKTRQFRSTATAQRVVAMLSLTRWG